MISFDGKLCGDLDESLQREWLETNGLGGFASSTINGLNTRRYHGLLVAATKPPVGRMVLLSKMEETLLIDGRPFELSSNQYASVIHPQGYQYQTGFRLDPFPVFTYRVEGVLLEKSVFMIQDENTTVIQYELKVADEAQACLSTLAPRSYQLELRPLIAFRDYHGLTHENGALNSNFQSESDGQASFQPYADLPTLHFAYEAGELESSGYWYRTFEYAQERERGFDDTEDLFNPFVLKFNLDQRARAAVIVSTERRDARRVEQHRQEEIERRERIVTASAIDNDLARMLAQAADQYIVARENCKTIIAGYHWFGDWGRDTMIALPGLTLVTGRADIARRILVEFSKHASRGMLPNRFPDAGAEPEYNTVDATLWFFEAIRALLEYTHDYEFVREHLYKTLVDIISWHVRGTRYNIRVDADGLLNAGEEGVQLTWMDARVDGRVITPRHGKPVEIQALWYNALRTMENLAREFQDEAGRKEYGELASQARRSFNEQFWNEEAGCLYDVVNDGARDASIRPNQILAISLAHTMLSQEKAGCVLAVVERELLTPYGLRSLSPNDTQYRGRYEGNSSSRDAVYHQGAVWAWLIGPFITAYIRVFGEDRQCREKVSNWLAHFREHMSEACLGHISEIFDGDAPHTPRGCVAQAWSVAELLRAVDEAARKGRQD